MNQAQKLILKVAAAVMVAMLLFPPFHFQFPRGANINLGYGFLFDPPKHVTWPSGQQYANEYVGAIDIAMLLVQLAVAIVVAAICFALTRDERAERVIDATNDGRHANRAEMPRTDAAVHSEQQHPSREASIEKPAEPIQQLYEAIIGSRNTAYYLEKFEQFDQQGPGLKASWNWPAFLCNGTWALYRKMYGWFFAFLGILTLSSMLQNAVSPGASFISAITLVQNRL